MEEKSFTGIDENWLEEMLAHEVFEDSLSFNELDNIEMYLAEHSVLEETVSMEYEMAHGGTEEFHDYLEDRLSQGMESEEKGDIRMYDRILDRLASLPNGKAKKRLLERFAPEIIKGRRRSFEIVNKAVKARQRLNEKERKVRASSVSLKPKQKTAERSMETGMERFSYANGRMRE